MGAFQSAYAGLQPLLWNGRVERELHGGGEPDHPGSGTPKRRWWKGRDEQLGEDDPRLCRGGRGAGGFGWLVGRDRVGCACGAGLVRAGGFAAVSGVAVCSGCRGGVRCGGGGRGDRVFRGVAFRYGRR